MASLFRRASDVPGSGPETGRERRCDVRLFGALRVLLPDGSNATPAGRKARALIAYLLLADGQPVSRDRLAGLLWSERGEDQARASLRQTFYEMRALTSGDAALVVSDRAQARIETARVVTDLERMHLAAATPDAATLATLVGDKPQKLLTDLDGIDPAFDEWLAVERTRRGDERRRTVLAVADKAFAIDDIDGAHQLAVRLLASDPTDETGARLAMEASHRRGDRDAVRQTFLRVQEALRLELGIDASEETVTLHQRLMSTQMPQRASGRPEVPGRAEAANDDPMQREIADPPEVERAPAVASSIHWPIDAAVALPVAGAIDEATTPSHRSMPRFARRSLIALVGTVLVAATAVWLRPATVSQQRVLRVEPFEVASTDTAARPLRTGFATDLARLLLGNDTRLNVVDATQSVNTAGSGRRFVVEGDAHSVNALLHVDLKLLREGSDTILWSGSVTRPASEIDALREQMAARVADVAVCALGGANARLEDFKTETIRLMLGACEEKHGDWNESVKLLKQVVAMEPDYAHGWAMLSAATSVTESPAPDPTAAPSANVNMLADRALALDPHEGEAYFAKANVLNGAHRWMQRMAMVEAGRAVEPGNAALESSSASNLAQVGRLHEAIGFSQRAVAADPFSAEKAAQRIRLLGLSGDLADAGIALQAAHRRFGSSRSLALNDFRLAALAGDTNHAQAMLADPDRGFVMQPDRIAMWKALIAARATPSTTARDEAYKAFTASMAAHPQVDLETLEKLAVLQRIDEAYETADRLPAEALDHLQTSVLFTTATAPLRADPRFMTLAARLGLVAIWTQTDKWPDFCAAPSLAYDCRVEAKRALSSEARALVAAR